MLLLIANWENHMCDLMGAISIQKAYIEHLLHVQNSANEFWLTLPDQKLVSYWRPSRDNAWTQDSNQIEQGLKYSLSVS